MSGMLLEPPSHFPKGAWQILFVTVQPCEDITVSSQESLIDRIVHSTVRFLVDVGEGLVRGPFIEIRATSPVLDNVFVAAIDFLIRHTRRALPEVVYLSEAGCDDGEHGAFRASDMRRMDPLVG